jgi:ABC-type uncharacterized transport system substrate-binding protein
MTIAIESSSLHPKVIALIDYIFFQDIDHDYYFKPLSSFKKKEVKWKYKVIPPTPDLTLEAAKYSVLRHSCEEFAPIENALSGMLEWF